MVSRIPVWVFFIFAALLLLGTLQARTRCVAPGAVSALALAMFGLSLYGVIAAFGAKVAPLAAWALGMSVSATLGRRIFGPRGLVRVSSSSVQVPGSWLPLALMMGIFAAKFGLGFATAIGSPIVAKAWFAAAASLVFGLLSGAFTARALTVRNAVRGCDVATGSARAAVC